MSSPARNDEVPQSMREAISILLAEPNALLREKIAGLLARHDGVRWVAQVGGGAELGRAARDLHPNLILADLSLLRDEDSLRRLRGAAPNAQLVALTDNAGEPYGREVARLHLDGLLARWQVVDEIADRLRALREAPRNADAEDRRR